MWFFDSGYFAWLLIPILYCPGKELIFVTLFAGVDGIECFDIEISSATHNWLKISEIGNDFVK